MERDRTCIMPGCPLLTDTGSAVGGMATDGQRIFWIELGSYENDTGDASVRSVASDGGDLRVHAESLMSPFSLSVQNGSAYWLGRGGVHAVPADGGSSSVIMPGAVGNGLVATRDRKATDHALELYASMVADRSAAQQVSGSRRQTSSRRAGATRQSRRH